MSPDICNLVDVWRCLESGNAVEAHEMLRRIVLDWKNDPLPWLALGNVHQFLGQYWRAKNAYKRSLRIEESVAAHAALAVIYSTCDRWWHRDKIKGCIHATAAMTLAGGQNWPVLTIAAAAYANIGLFDGAVLFMKAAMRRCPDEVKERFQRRLQQYLERRPCRLGLRSEESPLLAFSDDSG